jgi:hypothetical protein
VAETLHGFATALGIAAALAAATVLAFAAVVAGLAAALAFAAIFSLAIVLAHVAARRVGARRVRIVLRVSLRRAASQQSGDGCGDEECSLCSAHNVCLCYFYLDNPRHRRKSHACPSVFGD